MTQDKTPPDTSFDLLNFEQGNGGVSPRDFSTLKASSSALASTKLHMQHQS
jgi:hypothetical protein